MFDDEFFVLDIDLFADNVSAVLSLLLNFLDNLDITIISTYSVSVTFRYVLDKSNILHKHLLVNKTKLCFIAY